MITTEVRDGTGSDFRQKVTNENAALVSVVPHPDHGTPEHRTIFRQFMTSTGLAGGSRDMRVDGSTTPVEFWVPANGTKDRYISMATFLIVDAGAKLNVFGNIGALASPGCKLEYDTGTERITIADELLTNFDFFRMTNFNRPFGTGAAAYQLTNIVSTAEGYAPVLSLKDDYMPPFGIKLAAGSTQKLIFTVGADISTPSVDQFDGYCVGFELGEK